MTSGKQARVVFLWHMHQPSYRSPITGEYLMPWALVHGMRDYYDMAELASRDERVHVTVNLVPGMLQQIEEYASGVVSDLWLGTALKAPEELTQDEKKFVLANFVNVHRDTMVKPFPRFLELVDKAGTMREGAGGLGRFTQGDWGDLQVYFFLAWTGGALRRDPRVAGLLAKGKGFNQGDKQLLKEASLELLRGIVPLYRKLYEEGRMEVSCSPMYHPILPLLVDTMSAREAVPEMRLPGGLFLYPEDARRQVERGLGVVSGLMGKAVAGMWPSEGAVSKPVMKVLSEAGVKWIATDEKVLLRSVGPASGFRGDLLYRPWRIGKTAVFFRDAGLSDLIGFAYSRWKPEAAVEHFKRELYAAAERSELEKPVITIAMDGENAWEHYVHGGMRFVELLYQELAKDQRFRLVTPTEVLGEVECGELEGIRAGSWIDGSFRTWIGDSAKNRGWEHLLAARQAVAAYLQRNHQTDEVKEALLDLLDRAEASDWFWWLGEGHTSPYDAQFDLLFRHHLKALYHKVGLEPPEELERPLDEANLKPVQVTMPAHWISPQITGREDSYYKWLSAGRVLFQQGFMHRPNYLVKELRFGFDRENLYFKIEASGSMRELLRLRRLQVELHLVQPEADGVRLKVEESGRVVAVCARRGGETASDAEVCIEHSAEVRVPMKYLRQGKGIEPGTMIEMYVLVLQDGKEIERFPAGDNVSFTVRGEDLDAENWHV